MIKKLAKLTLILSYSLIAHNYIWNNLIFNQQVSVLIKVALILAFFETILKPIIKLLLLPITFLTLGVIRVVINTLGLYLASFTISDFSVQNISTTATSWQGFNIPPLNFNHFFAFLVSSISINIILSLSTRILYKKKKI